MGSTPKAREISSAPTDAPTSMKWIVCQIGAREHYAIPRALQAEGRLTALLTDLWARPGASWTRLPGLRRARDRYHPGLADAGVFSPTFRTLLGSLGARMRGLDGWSGILERNDHFQRWARKKLGSLGDTDGARPALFSYSYAARHLFEYARNRGWCTVLGQIDPGPEEERLVQAEHARYPGLGSTWRPAPPSYWTTWRTELDFADVIVVNSPWSRACLIQEGVPASKLRIIPLVYEAPAVPARSWTERTKRWTEKVPFEVLFLGQITLRKGVGRLLDAMRLLRGEPIRLTLAGPSEIPPAAWADLPNVRWLGPIPRSDVSAVYAAADVFILPTLSDGFAITQLEALANGLPIIASQQCGAVVDPGRTGWILPDLEPETIARTVLAARTAPVTGAMESPLPALSSLAASLQQAVDQP